MKLTDQDGPTSFGQDWKMQMSFQSTSVFHSLAFKSIASFKMPGSILAIPGGQRYDSTSRSHTPSSVEAREADFSSLLGRDALFADLCTKCRNAGSSSQAWTPRPASVLRTKLTSLFTFFTSPRIRD